MPTVSRTRKSTGLKNPSVAADHVRRRALERLYAQKAAVDELISSLEYYQQAQQNRRAECIEFNIGLRYLPDSGQSRI